MTRSEFNEELMTQEIMDEVFGGTNPDCRGHDVADGDNSHTVWCAFEDDCPDA